MTTNRHDLAHGRQGGRIVDYDLFFEQLQTDETIHESTAAKP